MLAPATLPLLVAEDDANDMFLFTRLLNAAGTIRPLHIALDGREALRLLAPVVERNALGPRPAIAFLDVRMPHHSGLEVLKWIRSHRILHPLPVVLFANQPDPVEIATAESLGAQGYLKKFPSKFTMIRLLEQADQFNGHDPSQVFDLPDNLLRKKSGSTHRDAAHPLD